MRRAQRRHTRHDVRGQRSEPCKLYVQANACSRLPLADVEITPTHDDGALLGLTRWRWQSRRWRCVAQSVADHLSEPLAGVGEALDLAPGGRLSTRHHPLFFGAEDVGDEPFFVHRVQLLIGEGGACLGELEEALDVHKGLTVEAEVAAHLVNVGLVSGVASPDLAEAGAVQDKGTAVRRECEDVDVTAAVVDVAVTLHPALGG